MSTKPTNRRLGPVGMLILSAAGLFALALPLNSAKAQCLGVDLGFGCAGLGVGSWYGHPYHYGYPYHHPYYYPYSYSYYPYYGAPAYTYTPAGRPDYGY